MDAPLYDVYLTGKLADDVSPALAAQRLAALFKSTPAAMAGLITGKAQLLKRGVDKNTALKYRDTLQKAGCEVVFKAQVATIADEKPKAAAQPASTIPSTASAPPSTSGLQLAPAGADLLRAEERHVIAPISVDTAHLSLAPVGPLPTSAAVAVAAPDTDHLTLAAVGDDLLSDTEHVDIPVIAPDISGLSVAEVGAPIETLKTQTAPLEPDTSGLELAPAGSDLLTAEQRQHAQPAPPNTDHIKLAP